MQLLISLVVLVIVLFISAFWEGKTKNDTTESELHARDRYAVAEKIGQELKEKQRSVISHEWAIKQTNII